MNINSRIITVASVLLALLAPVSVAGAEEGDYSASFSVSYDLVSEYIWRGQNFSDYDGEGTEDLNHQFGAEYGLSTPIGDFAAGIWFEVFEGQKDMDAASNSLIQEVDYYIGYSVGFDPVSIGVTWTYFAFPQSDDDAYGTNEIALSLGLDDSCIFGQPILSPSVTWNMDLDLNEHNSWIEIGISHDFELVENFCLSPSLTLGIDNEFTDGESTRFGNLLYSLGASYDLSSLLPEGVGELSVGASVSFSQALGSDDVLNDEFFGGVSVGYAF